MGPLRRFFVDEINAKEGSLSIKGAEARHITAVMRMGPGDRMILMDGKGARFQALIVSAHRHEVLVTLEKVLPAPPSSPLEITICQALLKSHSMDYLIQKTSELGVGHIFPFLTERTVVKPSKEALTGKLRRWREIALSATKQSGRARPPEIHTLHTFSELMDRWKGKEAEKIILWEDESTRDLKGLLRSSRPAARVVGVVGPEGGFSREEVRAAVEAGFVSASLGHRVLRAETAAMTLVALLQYEWGDLSLRPIS